MPTASEFRGVFSLLVSGVRVRLSHGAFAVSMRRFQIIDPWMGVSFSYFRFQSAMLLFQLCEMRVADIRTLPFSLRTRGQL